MRQGEVERWKDVVSCQARDASKGAHVQSSHNVQSGSWCGPSFERFECSRLSTMLEATAQWFGTLGSTVVRD